MDLHCSRDSRVGLGDVKIRLQPTVISGLIEGTRAVAVSCGHRHSLAVFNYHPLRVMDDAQYQPYLKILEVRNI